MMSKTVSEFSFHENKVEIAIITIVCVLITGCLIIDNIYFNFIEESKEVRLIKDFAHIYIAAGGFLLISTLYIFINVEWEKSNKKGRRNIILLIIFSIIILTTGIFSLCFLRL